MVTRIQEHCTVHLNWKALEKQPNVVCEALVPLIVSKKRAPFVLGNSLTNNSGRTSLHSRTLAHLLRAVLSKCATRAHDYTALSHPSLKKGSYDGHPKRTTSPWVVKCYKCQNIMLH